MATVLAGSIKREEFVFAKRRATAPGRSAAHLPADGDAGFGMLELGRVVN
jgi:hypothetical protein